MIASQASGAAQPLFCQVLVQFPGKGTDGGISRDESIPRRAEYTRPRVDSGSACRQEPNSSIPVSKGHWSDLWGVERPLGGLGS